MELKDFVRETLVQIVQGVSEAAGPISDLGGYVSPAHHPTDGGHLIGRTSDSHNRPVHAVAFDVAVVAGSDSTMAAGGGLKVMGVRLGADASSGEREQTSSRIQFMVPLALPIDPRSQNASDDQSARARANAGAAIQYRTRGVA